MSTSNKPVVAWGFTLKDLSVKDFEITMRREPHTRGGGWTHTAHVRYSVNGERFHDSIALETEAVNDVRTVKDVANLFLEQLTGFLKAEALKELASKIEESFSHVDENV